MPNRNQVLAFALDRWSRSCHSRHWKLLESHRWTSLCSTKDLQTERPLWCFPQWGSFCLFGDGRMKLTRFISLPWRILDPSRLRYGLPSGRVWDSREFWAACVKIDVRGRLNMEPDWSLMMKQMLLILQGLKVCIDSWDSFRLHSDDQVVVCSVTVWRSRWGWVKKRMRVGEEMFLVLVWGAWEGPDSLVLLLLRAGMKGS